MQHVSRNPTRTRVKICGVTRVEDALAVAELGADAIGLNFYPKSPRYITLGQARSIGAAIPAFVTTVALFVNASAAEVEQVIDTGAIDLLQFHGDENPEFCSSFGKPYIKALRMKPGVDFQAFSTAYASAKALLLDAWDDSHYGGTGKTFDWESVRSAAGSSRIILAGGLTPANVAQAINTLRPWAVDVSSGVEQTPGIKSAALMQQFISEVNRV